MSNIPNLNPSTPLSVYQAKLGTELVTDDSQLQAVLALEALYQRLDQNPSMPVTSASTVKGLYLWGDVGRGKTYLMDLFFECVKQTKLRLHFHRFMARIHQELHQHAGQRDPLSLITKNIAKECRVLCFDEFFVSDIGDAMLLAGLFESLFAQGVILVATSNIPIERLYENGLARHKFLPCIALLQTHTESLHLNGAQDHRLHSLNPPLDVPTTAINIALKGEMDFNAIFNQLTHNATEVTTPYLVVCNRHIPLIRAAVDNSSLLTLIANQEDNAPTTEPTANKHSVAWFDFYALCDGPRSQLDYIDIASRFQTIMLSDVPRLGGEVKAWIRARGTEDGTGENQAATTGERTLAYAASDDPARRFISLIDELYDQNVRLYLSCDVPLAELYQGGALNFEFRRTYSRLIEMSRRI